MIGVERERKVVDMSAIPNLVKGNANLFFTGRGGDIDSGGYPPETLIGPSRDYLLSLYGPEDRELMKKSLQTRLTDQSPEQQLRSIFGDIFFEWQKNVP